MDNNDFFDDQLDDQDEPEEQVKSTINIDARRKVEAYQAQRELERLINDDFDYLDDIA